MREDTYGGVASFSVGQTILLIPSLFLFPTCVLLLLPPFLLVVRFLAP